MRFFALFCLILASLTGCGYQMGGSFNDCNGGGESPLFRGYQTITVPYVEGDTDGSLTAAIVKELVKSQAFEYRSSSASLALLVKKINLVENNIGFRYDRKKYGQLTKDIIPTETRLTLFVEVMVVDALTDKTLLGPIRLTTSEDFDHDYYFSRDGVNVFSLGQLTDIDAAYDAVEAPLQDKMAKKIVDYVTHSW